MTWSISFSNIRIPLIREMLPENCDTDKYACILVCMFVAFLRSVDFGARLGIDQDATLAYQHLMIGRVAQR